ncbi:MAG: 30S ribosomal protein S15 [Phycisphaerales bacterium]|nr:MAG: 30S ribosomal protein S15 [Phycisphaerales bacterium]
MALTLDARRKVIGSHRRHEKDTGSPEVQVAMLTHRIRSISDHLQTNKKDNHSRRGLVMMVGQRNRLLRYLARTNPQGYQDLIARLGLRK